MSVFIRLLGEEDKATTLASAVAGLQAGSTEPRVLELAPSSFAQVPGAPFAYWVSEGLRTLFRRLPAFEGRERDASIGASTKNDFRYVRLWFEISRYKEARSRRDTERGMTWVPFAKGGAYSLYQSDVNLAVNWANDGQELKADISEYRGSRGWGYQWSAALNGHDYYFHPGLTWPRRTNGLNFCVMPLGCIFADKGPAAFVSGDCPRTLLALLAVLNATPFRHLVSLRLARTELAQSYEVGLIQKTPVPELPAVEEQQLAILAQRAWSVKHSLDTRELTSYALLLPALLQVSGETVAERVTGWAARVAEADAELAGIQAEIDQHCFNLYGFGPDDRAAANEAVGGTTPAGKGGTEADDASESAEDETTPPESPRTDPSTLTAALFDWLVGVAFGRFDIRLATGE